MAIYHLLFCLCLFSEERESWIRAKYEQKLFVAPLPPPTPGEGPDITLSGRLLLAVMEHNLPKVLLLLAHCTKDDINAPLSLSVSSRALLALRLPGSALHAACQQADVVMTQLLIWVCLPQCLLQTPLKPLYMIGFIWVKGENCIVTDAKLQALDLQSMKSCQLLHKAELWLTGKTENVWLQEPLSD